MECPQNGLFHDAGDVILTSQMAIREMADHDYERPMTIQKDPFLSTFFGKITTATELLWFVVISAFL